MIRPIGAEITHENPNIDCGPPADDPYATVGALFDPPVSRGWLTWWELYHMIGLVQTPAIIHVSQDTDAAVAFSRAAMHWKAVGLRRRPEEIPAANWVASCNITKLTHVRSLARRIGRNIRLFVCARTDEKSQLAQMALAFMTMAVGANFVVEVDSFGAHKLLRIAQGLFEHFYMCRPLASLGEIFFVGYGFRGVSDDFAESLLESCEIAQPDAIFLKDVRNFRPAENHDVDAWLAAFGGGAFYLN